MMNHIELEYTVLELLELALRTLIEGKEERTGLSRETQLRVGEARRIILEQALKLLQAGKSNVIEVSYAVGYSNPSHFAERFRKKFGVNPSALLCENSSRM